MINNRQQSGRRRGRGGQRPGGGAPGGGGGGGSANRIDNRARGNANQLWEKYKSLAADSARAGDRVQTEYYLQFADHYYRVLAETRPNFHEQQREQRAREDRFDEDGDADGADYAEEGEAIRPGEQAMQQRGNGGNGGGERNERRFDERRPRRDDEDRPRRADEDRPRRAEEDRPRRAEEDRRPQRADEDRPRRNDGPVDGARADGERRPRRDRDDRFNGQPRAEVTAPVESQPVAAPISAEVEPDLPLPEPVADTPQPRRRGRPRKEVAEEPLGFDADRLPPALNAPANDADEPAQAKPRRRRTRVAGELPAAE